MPKVSVIVPLFNTERFIEATLRSAQAQSFTDWDIIVVDNGSSDAGPERVRALKDDRIRLIRFPNGGVSGARNEGIRQTNSPFIALLDSDDIWLPNKLGDQLTELERDSTLGMVFTRADFIDETGKSLKNRQEFDSNVLEGRRLLYGSPIASCSTALLRRRAIEDVQLKNGCYFREELRAGEDADLWLRIALTTSWKIRGLDKVLTQYRIRAGSLMASGRNLESEFDRLLQFTSEYAPQLILEHGNAAKAHYLRFLARRSLYDGDRALALHSLSSAFLAAPGFHLKEPMKTLETFFGICALYLFPKSTHRRLLNLLKSARAKLLDTNSGSTK